MTTSPYLGLPKRSELEVREMRRAEAMAGLMDHLFRPAPLTPAQRWLGSDHLTKKLEQFRKEDGE